MNNPNEKSSLLTRRRILAAGLGAAAAGSSLLCSAQEFPEPTSAIDRPDRPWVLPEIKDPATWSTAENRFWLEVLRDHSDFFTLLMPGDALSGPRREVEAFRK